MAVPFLKWAGGKRQLLPQIRRCVPLHVSAYAEPFLGSGALFFDLVRRGRLPGVPVRLSDTNADLIGTYVALRDDVEAVIGRLERLARGHARDASRHYYEVRDGQFNRLRSGSTGVGRLSPASTLDLAAAFIYLNRTCFNGLYRTNALGAFNTPLGRYARPRICDADNLRAVARVLQDPRITLATADYQETGAWLQPGGFVYFDPPYAPLSRTAHFRAYTAAGFSDEEQQRLRDLAVVLAARQVHVLLSNSVSPLTRALYESPLARQSGLRAFRVSARRAISTRVSGRIGVTELLVTTLPRRHPLA
jgi:DNA adenine methylase